MKVLVLGAGGQGGPCASILARDKEITEIVLADMVYLAGGKNHNDEYVLPIQYLPPKDSWVEIDSPPVEIGFAPAVLPYETRLYVIGGYNSDGYSNQSLVYQAVYTILVPVVR